MRAPTPEFWVKNLLFGKILLLRIQDFSNRGWEASGAGVVVGNPWGASLLFGQIWSNTGVEIEHWKNVILKCYEFSYLLFNLTSRGFNLNFL